MPCHAAQIARGAVLQQTRLPALDHLLSDFGRFGEALFGLFHCRGKHVEIKPRRLRQPLHPFDVIGGGNPNVLHEI